MLLPSATNHVPSSCRSGGSKRKARNSLPQIFLMGGKAPSEVIGAMVILRVCQLSSSGLHVAVLGGSCLLDQPVVLTADSSRYRGVVFALAPGVEQLVRQSPSATGHALNEHFTAFASSSWRCWILDNALCQAFRSNRPPAYISIERKHLQAIGVEAEIVANVLEICPGLEEGHGVGAGDIANSARPTLPPTDDGTNSGDVAVASADALRAAQRLHEIARPTSGGIVTHTYDPFHILAALQLRHDVKPSVHLPILLAHAAPFFFGREGAACISQELQSSVDLLPSASVLREATIRLDLMDVLWQRKLFQHHDYWRYLGPDGSPQLGWNWLVLREDAFIFPMSEAFTDDALCQLDYNKLYSSRICLLSTTGRGRATLLYKSMKMSNIHKMESACNEDWVKYRSQVFGVFADEGTESGCADIDAMVIDSSLEEYSDERARMYPNAIYMPEHLHKLFNALQHGVERLSVGKRFIHQLRSIERFLSDKSLRRLFMATCILPSERHLFAAYSTVHIDWRWEMLSIALNQLIPKLRLMVLRWDRNKLRNAGDEKIDTNSIRDCDEALRTPFFLEFCVMIQTKGGTLERYAHRLEGCECHRALWMSKGSLKRKSQILKAETGSEHCYLKGRQGAWFQAVGYDALITDLQTVTSDLLQELMSGMPDRHRSDLVKLDADLTDGLVEEVRDKLAFHFELPWSIIKIFYGEIPSGDHEKAREFARQTTAYYDRLCAAGKRSRIHRVAQKLLDPSTECRRQLDLFKTSEAPLHLHPVAYSWVKRYAMIPLVGRKIEMVHALIKQIGAVAPNCQPPYVSSTLREAHHLKALELDQQFHTFCLERWRSKSLCDDVLKLIVSKEELAEMSHHAKLHRVYQCDIESEFRDMGKEKEAHAVWIAQTKHLRNAGPVDLGASWKLCIGYLKTKLQPGRVFTLPKDLYIRAVDRPIGLDVDLSAVDPFADAIMAHARGRDEFNMQYLSDVVFFEVVNAHPERRKQLGVHHLDHWTDAVAVVRRDVVAHDALSQRVIILNTSGQDERIHASVLAADIIHTLRSFFRWTLVAHGSGHTARKHIQLPVRPSGSALLTRASDVLEVETRSLLPEAANAETALVIALPNDSLAVDCLSQIRRACEMPGVDFANFMDLSNVAFDTVCTLARCGALSMRDSEFGELQLSIAPAGVMYIGMTTLGLPEQVLHISERSFGSKLDAILSLLRNGWENCRTKLAPHVAAGPFKFYLDKRKPTSYFACLAQATELFQKGVPSIPHDTKDLHYQCLLRLSGSALQTFLSSLSSGIDYSWCSQQLKQLKDDDVSLAEEVALDDIDGEPVPPEESELPPERLLPAPALLDAVGVDWYRCLCSCDGVSVKVYFDHGSHQSGRLRGYAVCGSKEHDSCYKYRFCDEFESRVDMAAFMLSWASSHADHVTKSSHVDFNPLEGEVSRVRMSLMLENF